MTHIYSPFIPPLKHVGFLARFCKSRYNNGDFVYSSLDRIDSDGDYTVDNTNPCCVECNDAKAKYTMDEYFTWIKIAYEYTHLENGFDEHRVYIERNIIPNDFNQSAFGKKFQAIKTSAKQREKKFEISENDIKNKIFDNCFYCGKQPLNEAYSHDKKHLMLVNGVDRRDNDIGYTPSNIIPCCDQCNYTKNSQTEEAFCNHIKRVYEYSNLNEYKPSVECYTHVMKHFAQIKSKIVQKK